MVTSAERAAVPEPERNLRAQGGLYTADDIAAKFLQTTREKGMLARAEKFKEAGNLKRAEVLENTAGAISRLNKGEKAQLAGMIKGNKAQVAKMVQMAEKEPEKLAKVVAEVAQKDPKKWSKMKKTIVSLLGVTLGGTIIWAAYQYGKASGATTLAA
ncbi:Secreted RxLR effector peptide protein [Phytophthora cinnamomi]|uniref:Secreted RxLR effector peptide protein n=1 Tax=Phytophthora cinnamomi TaxID=4785 RepID=UPI003559B74E|nr:Secreted RxLR effector peptide protein [Phytophthora cinnamomi]